MNNASVFSYQETDETGTLTGRTGKLRYYATYEELIAAGKTCIGILSEYSCVSPMVKQTYVSQKAFFHVKSDANTARVYQCCVSALIYSREKAEIIGEKMDRLLNLQDSTADVSWLVDDARYALLKNSYVKSTYNEETHNYTGGYSSNKGDSVYITPYRLELIKTTAQKDATGEEKAIYDFDRNETVVDFVLSPSVKYYFENNNPDATTTLTVTDVLPKGLSYKTDSAYLGGTYVPGKPNSGGGVTGGTLEGGTPITPVITTLEDETTQLVWTIPDYPLQMADGQPMPQITYQVTIDQFAVNNQQYLNQAMVCSTEDMRAYSAENGNLASYGIQVVKTAAISIAKVYDKEKHEVGEKLKWKLYVSNNADSGYSNSVFVDTLPYNGDKQGSKFGGGALRVASFRITHRVENMRVFYTTDELYRSDGPETNKTTAAGITRDEILSSWTEVGVAACGCVAGLKGKTPVAIAVLGDLPGALTFQAEIACYPENGTSAGDIFVNTFSRATNVVRSTEYVCGRSLSGLVWLDGNLDGIRSDAEPLLDGLNVELWKLDENGEYQSCGISIPVGKQYDYVKGGDATNYEIGSYRFTNLPAGTFAVRFVSDRLTLGGYQLSPYQTGDDRTRDSDGTAEGSAELSEVWIKAAAMPALEQLGSTEYRSEHNDIGLGVTCYVLPDTGGVGPASYWLVGSGLILAAAALLCLRKKRSA